MLLAAINISTESVGNTLHQLCNQAHSIELICWLEFMPFSLPVKWNAVQINDNGN